MIDSISLSDNWLVNVSIAFCLSIVLSTITYAVVGSLYESDAISGSIAGKICYFIIFIFSSIVSVFLLLGLKTIHTLADGFIVSISWSWIISGIIELFIDSTAINTF